MSHSAWFRIGAWGHDTIFLRGPGIEAEGDEILANGQRLQTTTIVAVNEEPEPYKAALLRLGWRIVPSKNSPSEGYIGVVKPVFIDENAWADETAQPLFVRYTPEGGKLGENHEEHFQEEESPVQWF